MELSAIHLFQTRDRTVPNNLLKTMQSGQVLVTNQEITPIMNEERNLQAFGSEEVSYQQLADRLTFSYDAGRGEAMPSSTPATNAMIQNNNVQSYFQYKREVFGNFWRKIVNDKILPKLMKDIKGEHILRLVGTPEEILQFDKEIAPHFIIEQMLHQYTESWYIDEEMLQGVTEKVMSGMKSMGTERFITVLKDAFKDVKHEFDFILTNEQRDTAIQAQNMFQVLSQLAQNPALLDDPVLRKVFYKYADTIGISPMELEIAQHEREQKKQDEEKKLMQQQQQAQQQQMQQQQMAQAQGMPSQKQPAQPVSSQNAPTATQRPTANVI